MVILKFTTIPLYPDSCNKVIIKLIKLLNAKRRSSKLQTNIPSLNVIVEKTAIRIVKIKKSRTNWAI